MSSNACVYLAGTAYKHFSCENDLRESAQLYQNPNTDMIKPAPIVFHAVQSSSTHCPCTRITFPYHELKCATNLVTLIWLQLEVPS